MTKTAFKRVELEGRLDPVLALSLTSDGTLDPLLSLSFLIRKKGFLSPLQLWHFVFSK